MTINLSILVPIYNEEKRLAPFLKDLSGFQEENPKFEIIFINDGSKDNSIKILKKYKEKHRVNIIDLKKNVGKAGALTKGVNFAKGDYILFIDADNAISPYQIKNIIPHLGKYDFIVGSRAVKVSVVKQPMLRKITSFLFNPYVNLLFNTHIKDHLCGFKAIKTKIARKYFNTLKSKRWIFDVELFFMARKDNYTIKEIAVNWVHKDGSKMKLFDPFIIGFRLLELRIALLRE